MQSISMTLVVLFICATVAIYAVIGARGKCPTLVQPIDVVTSDYTHLAKRTRTPRSSDLGSVDTRGFQTPRGYPQNRAFASGVPSRRLHRHSSRKRRSVFHLRCERARASERMSRQISFFAQNSRQVAEGCSIDVVRHYTF
jgi:hypothetical protein